MTPPSANFPAPQPPVASAPYALIDFPGVPGKPATAQPMSAQDLWITERGEPHPAAAHLLAGHDRFLPDTLHGWIDITATTLTSTFIGTTDPTQPSDSFRLGDDGPLAIPGSSLQGLLRNTVRILTGSRVGPINEPMLFLRQPVDNQGKWKSGQPLPTSGEVWRQKVVHTLHTQYTQRRGTERGGLFTYRPNPDGAGLQPVIVPLPGTTLPYRIPLADNGTGRFNLTDALREAGIDLKELPQPDDTTQSDKRFHPNRTFTDRDGNPLNGLPCWIVRSTARTADNIRIHYLAPDVQDQQRQVERRRILQRVGDSVKATGGVGERAILYITGITGVPRGRAYLFPQYAKDKWDEAVARALPVPADVLQLVQSADQLTRWQEINFTYDTNTQRGSETNSLGVDTWQRTNLGILEGHLPPPNTAVRHPVWFADNGKEVTAFGRSGGFRVAAHHDAAGVSTVLRGVPPALRPGENQQPDVVDALFGNIDNDTAYARRVRCSTLTADPTARVAPALTVQLLSPQHACFMNYIRQDIPQGPTTWASENVHLRGYKMYLHRPGHGPHNIPDHQIQGQQTSTDGTRTTPAGTRTIRPIPPGTTLHGRITFTNLTRPELGALITAIRLNNPDNTDPRIPRSAHKLGLGKALGLGSVHLGYQLHVIDPAHRYGTKGSATISEKAPRAQFAATLRHRHNNLDRTEIVGDWNHIPRIKQLFQSTNWADAASKEQRQRAHQMPVTEYSKYPLLP